MPTASTGGFECEIMKPLSDEEGGFISIPLRCQRIEGKEYDGYSKIPKLIYEAL